MPGDDPGALWQPAASIHGNKDEVGGLTCLDRGEWGELFERSE